MKEFYNLDDGEVEGLMLNINPKYLVNTKGRKTAVVLSMKEYRLLIEYLEDLEDTLEMDAAVETETDSRGYREIRAELKKEMKTCSYN